MPRRPVRARHGALGRRRRTRAHDRHRARCHPRTSGIDVEPVRGIRLDAGTPAAASRRPRACASRRGGTPGALRARVDAPGPTIGDAARRPHTVRGARRAPHVPGLARRPDRDAAPPHQHHRRAGPRPLRPRPLGPSTPAGRRRAPSPRARHHVRARRAHLSRATLLCWPPCAARRNACSRPTTCSVLPASPRSPPWRCRSAASPAAPIPARSATTSVEPGTLLP